MSMLIVRIFTSLGLLVFGGIDQEGNAFNKRGLTGFIPMIELHQNSALQPGDVVTAGPFQVGNFTGTTSLTNIVAGTTFEFGKRSNLTAS